jgi:hypothetical protein
MNKHAKIDKPKQLNLKDAETYELAAELAALQGDTLSGAVKTALRETLEREKHGLSKGERLKRMLEIAHRYARRAGPARMTAEEAIGYDENGLPT